jgi:hypothetical protein
MKTRNLVILCSILILIAISVMREIGLLELNFYASSFSIQNNSEWRSSKTISMKVRSAENSLTDDSANEYSKKIPACLNGPESEKSMHNSNDKEFLSDIPIIVIYKSKIIGDTSSLNPIKIDISNTDFGLMWIPLFKSSEFKISTMCKVEQYNNTNISRVHISGNGKINYSCKYKIIGLCTNRETKEIVIGNIMKDIYNDSKRKL